MRSRCLESLWGRPSGEARLHSTQPALVSLRILLRSLLSDRPFQIRSKDRLTSYRCCPGKAIKSVEFVRESELACKNCRRLSVTG